MSKPIWTPSPERAQRSRMMRFLHCVREEMDPAIEDYPRLYDWSVHRPEAFWPAVWAFCSVRHSRAWDTVLDAPHLMPGARWFTGSRLNFAENLLRYRDERPALVFQGEDGVRREWSYGALYGDVARVAAALRGAGVESGDRVAGLVPNCPEAVIAMLAATGIGAIWSSCSPDFGEQGILDRFAQIGPKVLFSADAYRYRGKTIDCTARVRAVAQHLPGLERVVIFPFAGDGAVHGIPRASRWDRFAATGEGSGAGVRAAAL
jgi:acetoacetyl-CoA synthetase